MSYLTQHFKGKYRIVPELSPDTHDVPREDDGSVDKSYDDLYIKCSFGNKIYYYGRGVFVAYIPSKIRGNNIVKELDKNNILFYDLHVYDSEVEFKFKAADMDTVANLLKAQTSGASISPFSSRNFPKTDVSIPTDKIEKYKTIIAPVQKGDLLVISKITQAFLSDILAKKLGYRNKRFDYKTDMKKLMMSRQAKEYIYTKNMWDEYLKYLEEEITKFYENKEK
ncbi:MAG TPA: hypothetical protein DCW90_23025 [Lachnospiraceae bacterium]|nr:hypothetical protein [Lachnospiraceae bacterium]